MGNILQFRPKSSDTNKDRVEAMVKGQLDVYVCDSCGEEFEVYFGRKPKRCPSCDVIFTGWNEEE